MHQQSRASVMLKPLGFTFFSVAICGLALASTARAADVNFSQIQQAALQGKVSQQVELAGDYFVGRGVPQDLKMAAYWYEKAAQHGDPVAQNEIGYMYQAGLGVAPDPARGCHWYQLAAASGFTAAKVNLGVAYLQGSGVPKDQALAARLIRDAAINGSGIAATYLGDLYYFGMGVDQDKAAAQRWFETAAKRHDALSAFNLGALNFTVSDHPHDFAKAANYFRQSAEWGYVPAMHSLAILLIKHPELAKSSQEIRTALEAAAESGFWRSSVVLGILARDGNGEPADQAAAYFHFQIAVLQGGDPAKKLLANDFKKLAAALSNDQLREQNARADNWFHQHSFALEFVHLDSSDWRRFPGWGRAIDENGASSGQLLPVPSA